jgi:hypothetical protein
MKIFDVIWKLLVLVGMFGILFKLNSVIDFRFNKYLDRENLIRTESYEPQGSDR